MAVGEAHAEPGALCGLKGFHRGTEIGKSNHFPPKMLSRVSCNIAASNFSHGLIKRRRGVRQGAGLASFSKQLELFNSPPTLPALASSCPEPRADPREGELGEKFCYSRDAQVGSPAARGFSHHSPPLEAREGPRGRQRILPAHLGWRAVTPGVQPGPLPPASIITKPPSPRLSSPKPAG